MKKFGSLLYIALFLLLLLLPVLGLAVFGEAQPSANEILTPRPRLTEPDGSFNAAFLSDFSDYIGDRFALRQEFVTAWAWLNARLLHTSVEEQVVLGQDGWLYNAETLDDYMGRGLTDGQLQSAARNLALMAEYAESRGAAFLFTLAPNKNSLYPERMPDYIPAGSGSNASRLPAFLAVEGVPYADLFAAFRGQDEVLYYETDSHWTNRGAALAADRLLAALGRDRAYFAGPFPAPAEHLGDLYEMLYPAGKRTEADVSMAFRYSTDRDPNGGDAISIRSHSEGSGSLLCYRDSFGAALYPYLAEDFGEALFSRQAAWDLTRIGELSADTVLLELVERNIPWLLSQPAVFPAPERPAPSGLREAEGSPVPVALRPGSEGTEGLVCVSGACPEEPAGPLLLQVGERWYEALTTLDGAGAPGFSAWVPAGQLSSASLALSCGGQSLWPCAAKE